MRGSGAPRILDLTGAPNARDLGGLRTVDGRTVRHGRLFRSGSLASVTDRDLGRLSSLGLARVLDLRGLPEIDALGPDRLPPSAPRTFGVPVFDPDGPAYALVAGGTTAAHLAALNTDPHRVMTGLYRGFVAAPALRRAFASAVTALAAADGLPALFHCTAGKDRTGWLSAVVLTLVGVPRALVTAEYLVTNTCLGEQTRAAVESLAARSGLRDGRALGPLLRAEAGYLDAAFGEAEARYGSFDGFVREGLGVDDAVVGSLREGLVG